MKRSFSLGCETLMNKNPDLTYAWCQKKVLQSTTCESTINHLHADELSTDEYMHELTSPISSISEIISLIIYKLQKDGIEYRVPQLDSVENSSLLSRRLKSSKDKKANESSFRWISFRIHEPNSICSISNSRRVNCNRH